MCVPAVYLECIHMLALVQYWTAVEFDPVLSQARAGTFTQQQQLEVQSMMDQ